MPRLLRLLVGFIVCLCPRVRAETISMPLSPPPPSHPRLLVSGDKFASLREQVETDPVSARFFAGLRLRADALLALPPVTYKKDGKRLLAVSRAALERISTLAMMARLTGETRYSDRAIAELRAVCAFHDWNPSHFLDTAEMTLAVAIGYDWLYDQLLTSDRRKISRAILELGLSPSDTGPEPQRWWVSGRNNWNQVCHAGMVAGAIALADEQPELARRIIDRAARNLHFAADGYAPDGAYPEGPGYWGYGTTFHVILVEAIEHFTGKPSDLAAFPGFLHSADYMLQMVTPTGALYSYSDCNIRTGENLTQYWFARRTGRADLLFGNAALLEASRPGRSVPSESERIAALALLWLDPRLTNATVTPPPLSWYGRGPNPVATHRSAWADPRATFIGLKGGSASLSHGHMDAGSFLLEADGVRWAVDPGMQSYLSLESKGVALWSGEQGGPRWDVFRLGPDAHNILRFDGAPPQVAGRGELVRFSTQPATAVVNLDAVYGGQVASVSRGVTLAPDRSVLIQDEWSTAANAVNVTWQMLTEADHVQADENEVHLAAGNATLTLRVLAPAGAKIAVEDVSKPRASYDAPNPRLKRITITTRTEAVTSGGFRIQAVPGSNPAAVPPKPSALAGWAAPLPEAVPPTQPDRTSSDK